MAKKHKEYRFVVTTLVAKRSHDKIKVYGYSYSTYYVYAKSAKKALQKLDGIHVIVNVERG